MKDNFVHVPREDFEDIIFLAFRYALGRRTYIVGVVSDLLIEYYDVIPASTRALIKKELIQAINQNKAGMDMDVAEWERVLAKFSGEYYL